jgi:hypothetical protein
MIAKILNALRPLTMRSNLWLLMYHPEQGQFTVCRADKECAVNDRLYREGRLKEMNAGLLCAVESSEAEAMSQIPVLAKMIGLRWDPDQSRWLPTEN